MYGLRKRGGDIDHHFFAAFFAGFFAAAFFLLAFFAIASLLRDRTNQERQLAPTPSACAILRHLLPDRLADRQGC